MPDPSKKIPAHKVTQKPVKQVAPRVIKKAKQALGGGSRARQLQVIPAEAPIESLLNSLEARKNAVDTLYACLKAERTYYDVFSKQMIVEPDYATRCSAAKTLLAYDVGEPVKRQQIIVTTVDSMDDLKAKLATNPALCESLAKVIEEAKKAVSPQNKSID